MNSRHASRKCHPTTNRRRTSGAAWFVVSVALCVAACSNTKNAPNPIPDPNQSGAVTSGPSSGSAAVAPAAGSSSAPVATSSGSSGAPASSAGVGAPNANPPAAGSAAGSGEPAKPTTMSAGGSPSAAAGTQAVAGMQAAGGTGGTTSTGECTRDSLKMIIDAYFTALAAHDPKLMPVADSVKFTENGETLKLGEGLWAKAGMVKFKESLLDTQKCGTVTQSVVPDGTTDIPVAVRLKVEAQKITEIQTIAVRSGDYIVASNTANMIALMPWGEIVPEDKRPTREQLEKWIDKYFRMFPMGVCNISSDCRRMENGFTLMCSAGASCSSQEPSGAGVMKPQIILADVEAGMAAGFTMFTGTYTDVHMIKYAGGEVHGVHTVLGSAPSSGWD